MKLQYTPDPAGHVWQLTAEGLPMNIHERSDFWRAHLDDGEYREMTVLRLFRETRRKRLLPTAHLQPKTETFTT